MADQAMSVVWIGAGTGQTITRIRTATGAATIRDDIIAVSTADKFSWWEGNLNINGAPAPAGGEYPAVNTVALLNFLCADGTIVVLKVPGPKISIFLSDGVTVDATTIPALIAACIGNLQSTSGSLATAFLGGHIASAF